MSSSPANDAPAGDRPEATCCARRALLGSVGVVGAAAVLSACGGGQGSARTGEGPNAAKEVITTAAIPVGGGKVFAGLQVVVTQPKTGQFKAFSAVCPHQGCLVGDVAAGVIICPCHGSQFDIATGAVRQGPATQPLASKTVTVKADRISVA